MRAIRYALDAGSHMRQWRVKWMRFRLGGNFTAEGGVVLEHGAGSYATAVRSE